MIHRLNASDLSLRTADETLDRAFLHGDAQVMRNYKLRCGRNSGFILSVRPFVWDRF